jgi:hypothetical protein
MGLFRHIILRNSFIAAVSSNLIYFLYVGDFLLLVLTIPKELLVCSFYIHQCLLMPRKKCFLGSIYIFSAFSLLFFTFYDTAKTFFCVSEYLFNRNHLVYNKYYYFKAHGVYAAHWGVA